jgi:ribosomal protein S18 acetylase RimI-like enzyme
MKRYIKADLDLGKYTISAPGGSLRYSVYPQGDKGKYIYLHGIMVDFADRGQGIGSELLDKLIAISDEHQIPIELQVEPFAKSSMDRDQLTEWYKRHGFTESGFGMQYIPKAQ